MPMKAVLVWWLLLIISAVANGIEARTDAPNILMIVAEDMSPRLGAYGDSLAKTPTLDALAENGLRFTRAYTVSGVCAPSRSSLITGVYATSMGTHQMRTSQGVLADGKIGYEAVPPPEVKAFPELLRAAGYSTANWAKKDYQFGEPSTIWDVDAGRFIGPIDPALWRRLPDDKPWFVMMNLVSTHESRLVVAGDTYPKQWAPFVKAIADERASTVTPVTDPSAVIVPGYFPDTPRVRQSIAQHYDNIHFMDSQVASILDALSEDGLSDDTIVIWTTDHGDPFPRAKRAVYESGTHVPLIIRAPGSASQGALNEQLVSFVDLAPTILGFAGVTSPAFIQGRDIFTAGKRQYVFSARDRMDQTSDRVRAVRDERYRLIRNDVTEIPYFRPLAFRDMFPIMREMWRMHEVEDLDAEQAYFFSSPRPKFELYDVTQDPDELINIAMDPAMKAVVDRLGKALESWISEVGDLGSVPEHRMVKNMWSGGDSQPVTNPPKVSIIQTSQENGRVFLSEETEGSSISWRQSDAEPWKLYTLPIDVVFGAPLSVKAIRYGFSESPTLCFTVAEGPESLPCEVVAKR